MSLQALHEFHQEINNELKICEQSALMIIQEAKTERQSMDEEKKLVVQECTTEVAQRQKL